MATSQDFVNWVCGPNLDPRFLQWVLVAEGDGLRDFGEGSTHTTIYFPEVLAFHICMPPLDVQRRIVAKLDVLLAQTRAAREQLEAVPALVEKYRQSVLAAAFRGDLTAEWRKKNPNVEPASKLLERIRAERRKKWEEAEFAKMKAKGKVPKDDRWKETYVESEPVDASGLPELPPTWAWVPADSCAWEITVGHVGPMKDEYLPEGIPFLRSLNVRANRFDARELKYVSPEFHGRLAKSALAPGDLVVVRTGAPGTACAIPVSLPEANCSDLVVVRLVPSVNAELAAFYINSQTARDQVFGMQVGVAQQHFNIGSMKRLWLPMLPDKEQAIVVGRLREALASADAIDRDTASAHDQLAAIDRAMLAKAFSGALAT